MLDKTESGMYIILFAPPPGREGGGMSKIYFPTLMVVGQASMEPNSRTSMVRLSACRKIR